MKMMKKALLFFCFGISLGTSAQNYLGIHSSNYAGVMGTDLQPASFVDSRFIVDVNLASFNLAGWTNVGTFNTMDMPKWWVKSFMPDQTGNDNPDNDWKAGLSNAEFLDRYTNRKYNTDFSGIYGVYNNVQVDLLNFMFHIKPK